jgi:ParB family chromosome partitioning protein
VTATLLPIDSIEVGKRLRPLNPESVTRLVDSIRAIGLQTPITVMAGAGFSYQLVTGHHRLAAAKALGWTEIPTVTLAGDFPAGERWVRAEKWEIAENLHRADLTALERDEHIAKWISLTTTFNADALLREAEAKGLLRQPDAKPGRPQGGVRAAARELGLSEPDARRAVTVANLPEEAKEAARQAGLDDNRTALLEAAKSSDPVEAIRHHVHRTGFTGKTEWYTPAEYVELARTVLGSIDLDPASNPTAQKVVGARAYYTAETNGLDHEWRGRVFLNPPYSQPDIVHFIDKAVAEYRSGRCTAAIVLTNNSTDTAWFQTLFDAADAICFTKGRVNFYDADGKISAPQMGQAFSYFGPDIDGFREVFGAVGSIVQTAKPAAIVIPSRPEPAQTFRIIAPADMPEARKADEEPFTPPAFLLRDGSSAQ